MGYVEFSDSDNKLLGRVFVQNGRALTPKGLEWVAEVGAPDLDAAAKGEWNHFTPADGEKWLEALPFEFRSGEIRATYKTGPGETNASRA